jgi:hypothetical protein
VPATEGKEVTSEGGQEVEKHAAPVPPEIVIQPGSSVACRLRVERNGFDDRINFEIENLPHGIIVDDIGLSGVLIPEGQTERVIFLSAEKWVPETSRLFHAVAKAEGDQASLPMLLHLRRDDDVGRADDDGEANMDFELNYDDMIHLDAEELAEGGIRRAYESLLPKLREYVARPENLEEIMDDDAPRYAVKYRETEYVIFGPEVDETKGNSWGRATHALFIIVNDQLSASPYRFFAINGGNDLGGMFLTPAQADAARKAINEKRDWPYLPTNEHPWYGMFN